MLVYIFVSLVRYLTCYHSIYFCLLSQVLVSLCWFLFLSRWSGIWLVITVYIFVLVRYWFHYDGLYFCLVGLVFDLLSQCIFCLLSQVLVSLCWFIFLSDWSGIWLVITVYIYVFLVRYWFHYDGLYFCLVGLVFDLLSQCIFCLLSQVLVSLCWFLFLSDWSGIWLVMTVYIFVLVRYWFHYAGLYFCLVGQVFDLLWQCIFLSS